MKVWVWAAILLCAVGVAPARAASFRWASDSDVRSLDPYAGREVFLASFDGNIYEPLVRRGRDLALEPALATAWTAVAPDRWRFTLRPGVVFQDGTPFTAADVAFSFARARAPGSRIAGVLARVKALHILDPRTVEFVTNGPDPILPAELTRWDIMSKAWCEAHDAATPRVNGYASDHADGTGPFLVTVRRPENETVLVANRRWWGERPEGAPDRVVFRPIPNGAARVAALISGAIDMTNAVPAQDVDRIAATPGLRLLRRPGLETIFLGMNQRPSASPFRHRRVRAALARAIDEAAIAAGLMHGLATQSGLMVAPGITGFDPMLAARWPYDPDAARRLLAAVGYPGGFATDMACPTDRYLNDAALCRTIVAMLGRIGVKVALSTESRNDFFGRLFTPGAVPGLFLLGWAPRTYDAEDMLVNLAATPDPARHLGDFNFGGYSNPALDRLILQIRLATPPQPRLPLLRQALAILKDDIAFIPLHQQDVVWAARSGVRLVERADGAFPLRYAQFAAAGGGR